VGGGRVAAGVATLHGAPVAADIRWMKFNDAQPPSGTRSPPDKTVAPGLDRRSGLDRRVQDKGPPGKSDRRRLIEARKPEVVELELSDSDWAALTQSPPRPAK
jgi:hypothetical protein